MPDSLYHWPEDRTTTMKSTAPPLQRKVLLVDDDPNLLTSLGRALVLRGFDIRTTDAAGGALESIETEWPDVVILDVSMPGLDGISFCRLIRDRYQVPILMLTARDSIEDRVSGLQAGADDYLIKPFALDEVVARINALVRRASTVPGRPTQLWWAGITLDRDAWRVLRDGEVVDLTITEFKLLEALMSRPGMLCTREYLLEFAWGDADAGTSNVVDAHMANLRKKLEDGGRPRIIQTVRRAGYKLAEE
jgi:DNA-binding response OmpR family regulator